jgi:DNA-binding transcriptional ArsR family regulator
MRSYPLVAVGGRIKTASGDAVGSATRRAWPDVWPNFFSAGLEPRLGDLIWLRLFSTIASHPDGEVCVCDITDVGVSQPTVSFHLKKLQEADLIVSERRGTWVYYAVAPAGLLE